MIVCRMTGTISVTMHLRLLLLVEEHAYDRYFGENFHRLSAARNEIPLILMRIKSDRTVAGCPLTFSSVCTCVEQLCNASSSMFRAHTDFLLDEDAL